MKFLVDNHCHQPFRSICEGAVLIQSMFLMSVWPALDSEICRYSEAQDRIIISKDEDFLYLASRPKAKIRLLWVQLGNCRTEALLAALNATGRLLSPL